MGRPNRFTVAEIETALVESNGLVTHAARRLGCAPNTIQNYVDRSDKLKSTLHWEREKLVDLAESKFRGHIEDGNLTAINFCLSTLGKKRGYVGKSELDVTDQSKVRIVIEEPPVA